ncbi:MAG: PDZ domain-containing protein [Planctomycetota bacterium]|nr:MAG: PDZ domain-containing protein [Planctomycetota bacterium]
MPHTSISRSFAAICAVVLCVAPAFAQSQKAGDALRRDIEYARDKVYPALVNIGIVVRSYSGGRARRGAGAGSGVIVSPAGHVLTNFHVAGHTVRITCTLPTGERIDADVVAHDPLTDLSVLKLRLGERKSDDPLPFATLGDSSKLRVGEYVLAMGNPLSLSSSLTLGVVSNTGRVFTNFQGTDLEEMDLGEGEVTGLFTRWIQHDALILPGNSGGPLVNLHGEVIGINELGGNGVGFAIPSNLANRVLTQVLARGEVIRGWLGITVLPVGKLGRDVGALVSSVVGGSPADRAGVRPGDLLLAIDDRPVEVRFVEQVPELYERIAELRPGVPCRLSIERGDGTQELRVEVARMEPFLGEEREFKAFGVTARAITGPMALARRFPDTRGVLLTGLRPGFAFELARPRMRPGDVVTSFAGQSIGGLDDFARALAAAKKRPKDAQLVVAYRRGEQEWLTLVKPPQDEPQKSGGRLRKPWLGVQAQVLTRKLAKALGLKGTKGFRVTQVYRGTEAAKAGLRPGDIITSVDGEELEASRERDAQELRLAIEDLVIGETCELGVLRAGKKQTLKVVLQESPASIRDVKSAKDSTFEFAVRELTFMDGVKNRWPVDQKGVLVVDCTSGGWANMAGLRVGDLIVEIQDQPVSDVAAFEARMKAVGAARPKVVKVFVRRGHRTHFVFIEPDWSSAD